jgi:hypothetical protein
LQKVNDNSQLNYGGHSQEQSAAVIEPSAALSSSYKHIGPPFPTKKTLGSGKNNKHCGQE